MPIKPQRLVIEVTDMTEPDTRSGWPTLIDDELGPHLYRIMVQARIFDKRAYEIISNSYTGDLCRGLQVAESLETGMAAEPGLVPDPSARFGGGKAVRPRAGGGHDGLDFTKSNYIAMSW